MTRIMKNKGGPDKRGRLPSATGPEPVKPRKFQLAIPEIFEGVVLKLLAKRPEDRFADAAALLKELTRVSKFTNVSL